MDAKVQRNLQGRNRAPMNDPKSPDDNRMIDVASALDTLALGVSPSESFAVLGAVMAQTLGMAMFNAVSAQQNAGTVRIAAVTMACAEILSLPIAEPGKLPAGQVSSPPGPVKPALAATAAAAHGGNGLPDAGGAASETAGSAAGEARIIDAINQIQSAVMSPQAVRTSAAGKAYQLVAHSGAIAIQDAADALRGVSIVATTGLGVAVARFLATGDPKFLLGITAAQDMIKGATDNLAQVSAAASAAVTNFPSS